MLDNLFTPMHLIVLLIVPVLFIILPFWRIFSKAGMPAPLALLMVVPFVNIAMLYFLAYAPWPTNQRLPKNY